MFFDLGNKKASNARPVAGGTVKGGKKVGLLLPASEKVSVSAPVMGFRRDGG